MTGKNSGKKHTRDTKTDSHQPDFSETETGGYDNRNHHNGLKAGMIHKYAVKPFHEYKVTHF